MFRSLIVNILINYCKNYPLKFEITYPYISKERRYNYYYMYASFLKRDYNITNNEELILNNSIKYNDTAFKINIKKFKNVLKF